MTSNSDKVQPVHIVSQQEKLDALFGITNGQDIDSFLSGLSLDQEMSKSSDALSSIDQLSSIEQSLVGKMDEIRSMPASAQAPLSELSSQMVSIDHSLHELEDIIDLSKDVIRHVHSSILATPLIDSEAVQAYSKLVESIHINISEFIGVYRDKQNFINKVKFAMFDHQQKKDLLRYKTDLQKELMLAKEGPKSIDADVVGSNVSWNVDEISKLIKQQEDSK